MPRDNAKGERGRCEDRAQATEEATTSLCLKQHLNVSAYAARDDEEREYITVAKYKDVLTWNRTEQGEWVSNATTYLCPEFIVALRFAGYSDMLRQCFG